MPKELRQAIADLERVVQEVAEGAEDARPAAEEAWREVLWQAWNHAEERKAPARPKPAEVVDFTKAIATNLRWWRTEMADWTQAQLAEAVNRVGLSWTRITVAEIENGTRKVSLEELLILAALYAVPMVELLRLDLGQNFKMPDGRVIDGGVVNELIAGQGAQWEWDREWYAAAYVARSKPGTDDWRPARSVDARLFDLESIETRERFDHLERRLAFNKAREPGKNLRFAKKED